MVWPAAAQLPDKVRTSPVHSAAISRSDGPSVCKYTPRAVCILANEVSTRRGASPNTDRDRHVTRRISTRRAKTILLHIDGGSLSSEHCGRARRAGCIVRGRRWMTCPVWRPALICPALSGRPCLDLPRSELPAPPGARPRCPADPPVPARPRQPPSMARDAGGRYDPTMTAGRSGAARPASGGGSGAGVPPSPVQWWQLRPARRERSPVGRR